MRKIREILRLRDEHGASQRQIATACRMPRWTVRNYLARLKEAGLSYAAIVAWSDDEIESHVFPQEAAPARPEPEWAAVARDLGRRGVTLQLLWQEYLEVHPGGYRYTQFVQRFRDWQDRHKAPKLLREHTPGERIEIDYAGMTLPVGLGRDAKAAQVFVAVLPYSGYIWADVTWSQRSEDWLGSHVRLFEHLGGVPRCLVPDNLKAGVSHASFYDPAINPGYLELARHYDTAVIPTRVRRPRDKGSAENGVQQVERRVLARLRNQQFASLDEARSTVTSLVAAINDAPFTRQAETTRRKLLETIERAALKPLPADRFVFGSWSRSKVADHYHVVVDDVAYSVPHRLIGNAVDIHVTASMVTVFHRSSRVACHQRQHPSGDGRRGENRVTLPTHRPANHRALERYTIDHVHEELAAIGDGAARLYERVLADVEHQTQAVRRGRKLLRLAGEHGAERLEAACKAALEANVGCDRYVARLITLSEAPAPPVAGIDDHTNVRGPSYYT